MKTLQYLTNDETKEASTKNSKSSILTPSKILSSNDEFETLINKSIENSKIWTINNSLNENILTKTNTDTSTTTLVDFDLLNAKKLTKNTDLPKTSLFESLFDLRPIYLNRKFSNLDQFYEINSSKEIVVNSVNYYLNNQDNPNNKSTNINNTNNNTSIEKKQEEDEEKANDNNEKSTLKNTAQNASTPWNILCKLINCKVAFKKQYNGKKYNWIQLAGHAGRFIPGDREGFILKTMEDLERKCLELLQQDVLAPFVPTIDKLIYNEQDQKHYTEMQDLLYKFHHPSIMDIKIGVRTFVVDDSDEKECKPRNDLYLKLIEMAPDEPSEKEHEAKAITKRRYMSWRERSTCSAQYGFRIEAVKKNHVSEKEFYSVKERVEAKNHFKNFVDYTKNIMILYLNRLIDLKNTLLKSEFFYSHELIGSSLLFVHDTNNAGVWMIDFGKTRPLPDGIKITHDKQWEEGTREDGYLIGIDSLIDIFQECITEL